MSKILLNNNLDKDKFEYRYSNPFALFIDIVKPQNLGVVGGRGTSKTTDILAKRFKDICEDIPNGNFVWTGNTYTNLTANVMPELITALESRHGWEKGVHFVIDEKPPAYWKQNSYTRLSYKHTISTYLGNYIYLKSLDKPSGNAGISVGHIFGDEVKYFNEKRLNKLTPTLRGDLSVYGHSHYFGGVTYTTDMPNSGAVGDREYSWLKNMAKNMDLQQLFLIYQAAMHLNQLKIERYFALKKGKGKRELDNILKNIIRWSLKLHKIRKKSTLYHSVSSFMNVDILNCQYFITQLANMEWEEFKVAILSFDVDLPIGDKFYHALNENNCYNDSYNDLFSEKGLDEKRELTSRNLKHILNHVGLEIGLDTGNQNSIAIGQPNVHKNEYRILKSMHVLTPQWLNHLADSFKEFFKYHPTKQIDLYADRAANNYSKAKKDYASEFKNALEYDKDEYGNKTPSGWTVYLKTVGQGNISHSIDYVLVNGMLEKRFNKLPQLLIDENEAKSAVSSMKMAPIKRNDKGFIEKDKRSEKTQALHKLPFNSTNVSDAVKYLICRQSFIEKLPINVTSSSGMRFG